LLAGTAGGLELLVFVRARTRREPQSSELPLRVFAIWTSPEAAHMPVSALVGANEEAFSPLRGLPGSSHPQLAPMASKHSLLVFGGDPGTRSGLVWV
jgi:hypothetical protein